MTKENKNVVIKPYSHSRFYRVQHSGMTYLYNNGGFTLIELLVVVLIIGILAAVAVPQYQKAVEKTKQIQDIAIVRTLYKGLEIYRLENGSYPPFPGGATGGNTTTSYFNDLLDVEVEGEKNISYFPNIFIRSGRIVMNWYIGGGPGKGILTCDAHPNDSDYNKYKNVCLSLCTDKQWRNWNHGEYCII